MFAAGHWLQHGKGPLAHSKAAKLQSQIGWNQLFLDHLATKWRAQFTAVGLDGARTALSVAKALLTFSWGMWMERNLDLHGRTPREIAQRR